MLIRLLSHTLKTNLSLLISVLVLALCSLPYVSAEEQNVNPGINKRLIDPDYQVWVGRFESPGREIYDRRMAIVDVVRLRPGMDIADIGAGTGLFTRLFAPAVGPDGTVYAVDIARGFIDEILHQAQAAGMTNVIGIVNNQKGVGLEPNSIDLAFVCATYHHFEYPRTMLQSIRRALRPGGSLIVIDFMKKEGISSRWEMSHTRADKQAVLAEIESEGFTLSEDREELLKTNYYLRFDVNKVLP